MKHKKDALFYRTLKPEWTTIVRGEGVYLYDEEGRKFMDGSSGIYVNNIGHGVPEIVEAIRAQAEKVTFVHQLSFLNEPLLELSQLLVGLAPKEIARAFYTSSGSEAVEVAMKMARKYHVEAGRTSKYKFLSRWQSWHGSTIGALSVSGRHSFQREYEPYLFKVSKIAPPYCTACGYGVKCNHVSPEELERLIKQEGPDSVAAFIMEPIVGGSAAAVMPALEYYKVIREICTRYNVLMIADEVVTAFGRTGKNFAIDHYGVTPDIIVTGKGLACGYSPVAGVLTTEEVFQVICKNKKNFTHGHTYSGNPLSCATALAVQKFIQKHGLVERSAHVGAKLLKRLKQLESLPHVGEVRGVGMLFGIELTQDKKTRTPFDPAAQTAGRIVKAALQRGLFLQSGGPGSHDGIAGDSVVLAPPFTLDEKQFDELVEPLAEAILEITQTRKKAA